MNCDCLHYLLNNKQSTALRTCFNIQRICVLYLYKYNSLFYAKHQTLYQASNKTDASDVRLVIHTANVALYRFKQYTDRNNFINKNVHKLPKHWTNNSKKWPKRLNPASRWIKFFSACRSAAGAWCNMIWSGESSFCCLLLFAHVKLIPEKQMLVFLTGHRHLFFLI